MQKSAPLFKLLVNTERFSQGNVMTHFDLGWRWNYTTAPSLYGKQAELGNDPHVKRR